MKFLKSYKGKDADMTISKKLASMTEADKLVSDAHAAWKEHVKPIKVIAQKPKAVNQTTTRRRVIRR